jgi:hypothetical protein
MTLAPRGPVPYLRRVTVPALLSLLLIAGCAERMRSAATGGEESAVALRNLEIESVDGHRAVLLRLSRLPTLVQHTSSNHPAEISVKAWGPVGEGDLAERTLPQVDPEISQVRVSRKRGALLVVIELNGEEPPPYSVHEMADWIMIRLGDTGQAGGTGAEG